MIEIELLLVLGCCVLFGEVGFGIGIVRGVGVTTVGGVGVGVTTVGGVGIGGVGIGVGGVGVGVPDRPNIGDAPSIAPIAPLGCSISKLH